jgi:twitching motility protein PilT
MPAANSIDELLERMVEANASDLHVTTGTPPVIRVRGEVERLEGFDSLNAEQTQQLLYRILSSEQQKNFELARQLDFSYSIPGLARFRVNVYFQRESIGAAFRLIRAEDAGGARDSRVAPRARGEAARSRPGDGPDRIW